MRSSPRCSPATTFNVYFQNNDDGHFVKLIKQASLGSSSTEATTGQPSILSLSWGGPDLSQSAMYTRAMNQAILARRRWG